MQAALKESPSKKGYWTSGIANALTVPLPIAVPESPAEPGVNAVTQALAQNRQAMQSLEQAWRICHENGYESAQPDLQEAMNALERQSPNLERAAQGMQLLGQATG